MTRPVTAVVPVHESELYVAETIRSLLAQTVALDEIVVVNDASTDRSIEIIEQFDGPIRVVDADVRHPELARGIGIDEASNDIVTFCDADDLWAPTKLERQLEVLGDRTDPVLVWVGVEEFVSPELDVGEYRGRPPHAGLERTRLISSLLTTVETCRLGDPALGDSDSWVGWVADIADVVPSLWVDDVLFHRRLHLTNFSSANPISRTAWLIAARARAQRAREDGSS